MTFLSNIIQLDQTQFTKLLSGQSITQNGNIVHSHDLNTIYSYDKFVPEWSKGADMSIRSYKSIRSNISIYSKYTRLIDAFQIGSNTINNDDVYESDNIFKIPLLFHSRKGNKYRIRYSHLFYFEGTINDSTGTLTSPYFKSTSSEMNTQTSFNKVYVSNDNLIRWKSKNRFITEIRDSGYLDGRYLPLTGGTMTGPLKWTSSTALPEQTNPLYFVVLDAFTDGGTTKWASKANILKALTGLTSSSVGSPAIPIYWTGSVFATVQATFGNQNYGEHNANNIKSNGLWYYTSNGPSTTLGASTTDGALYSQAYSTSWVAQIAQDYRNGSLFVRGLNNGTWSSWKAVLDNINRHAIYGTTGSTTYIKIKINSTNSWMLSFMVRVYQGYNHYDIIFSGYNYGNNYWYSPQAILSSSTTTSIVVYFGYESANNLFVVITGGSYTGIEILNVTNGYTQITDKLVISNLFTITNSSSLPTTIQKTDSSGKLQSVCNSSTGAITIYRPWLRNETVSNTTNTTNVYIEGANGDVNYPLLFTTATANGNSRIYTDSQWRTAGITFNPSSNTLKVDKIIATYGCYNLTSMRHLDAGLNSVHTDHSLYIGYGALTYTAVTHFYYSTGTTDTTSSRTEFMQINSNGAYALTRFGVNGQNTSYNLYVSGTAYHTGALYVAGAPAIQTAAGTGNWNYIRMHNGSNYWDIATKSNSNSGALDFRPAGADNIGPFINTNGRVQVSTISNSDTNYSSSAMWIREYHYGGSQSDSWSNAPRLGWHWSGRVAAQIGLASNGWLYEAPSTGTTFYRIVVEGSTGVTWGINISGNASTATKLQTARNINGTAFDGTANITTANWGTARTITIGNTGKSVNGSANVSWTLAEIGAAASGHTHTFVLGATTITTNGSTYNSIDGPFNINTSASADKSFSISRSDAGERVKHWVDDSIYHIEYTNDETANSIAFRFINTDTESPHSPSLASDTTTYLNSSRQFYPSENNTGSIGTSSYKWANMFATTFHGALTGNASTATKLQTARSINGTSFDGTANITTANWGTARTITIGNTGKSVNGSANVSWTLAEIGAASSGHTHYWANVQVSSSANTETNPQVNNIKARVFTILHPTDTSTERGTLTYKSGTYGWGDYLTTNSNGPIFGVTASSGVYMETSASSGLYVYGGSYYLQIRPESSTWASFYTNSTKYYFNKRIDVNGHVVPYSDLSFTLGDATHRWSNIYGNVLRLQGASSNPSASAGARIEFTYDSDSTNRSQPVYIAYTPNDSYRAPFGLKIFGTDQSGAWLEVDGSVYSNGFIKSGSSSSYVLLGNGGHKSVADWVRRSVITVGTSSTHVSYNANNYTQADTLYTSSGDVNSSYTDAWSNFPTTSAPGGGFSLFNIKEGGYVKQIFGCYNNNHLYIRGQHYSNGTVWNTWSTVALTTDNVASATKLQTARNINGTAFDGSADITTTKWGTARTITIGNTGKSVNGSANVSWTLAEIGAASSGHTHNSLHGSDNRTVNNTPAWYMTNVGKASIYTEFCLTGSAVSSTYENRTTFTPWGDNSGGRPVQLAFNNNGMFMRTSSSDTAWNAWNTIIHSGNYTSYVNNYYWANVKVSTSSNNDTTPEFGRVSIGVAASDIGVSPSDYSLLVNGPSLFIGNIIPNTDITNCNLGDATHKWTQIYGDILYGNIVYANTTGTGSGGGISLYSTNSPITYGIAMRTTNTTLAKLGRVQGDFATFFSMNDTTNRGWIFRSGNTSYASISTRGEAYFAAIGKDGYIPYPNGGQYTTTSSSVTGALCIELPVSWTNTMLKFEVDICNYSAGNSVTYIISGTNVSSTSKWVNTTAYSLRYQNIVRGNLPVRFGHNGTHCCVYIGETSSSWQYPQVIVRNFHAGYGNYDYNRWASGWSVSFVTSLGTITSSINNPAVNAISFTLGSTSINANGSYSSIQGPFAIRTSDQYPFSISDLFEMIKANHHISFDNYYITTNSDKIIFGFETNTYSAFTNSVTLSNNCSFYPSRDDTGSVGSSSNKWKNMYATTFNGTAYNNTSDIKLKYDIRDILNEDINKLFKTENGFIRHYKWRETNKDSYGFIAQELLEYCPEAVDFNSDNALYSVNYNVAFAKIIGAMFKKIKEQEQIIQQLKEKVLQ